MPDEEEVWKLGEGGPLGGVKNSSLKGTGAFAGIPEKVGPAKVEKETSQKKKLRLVGGNRGWSRSTGVCSKLQAFGNVR